MQAEMEITKQKEQIKGETRDAYRQTDAEQAVVQESLNNEAELVKRELQMEARNQLQNSKNNS